MFNLKKAAAVLLSASFMLSAGAVSAGAETAEPKKVKTVKYNDHVYAFFDTSYTWTEAKKYCSKVGGHLLIIDNEKEQEMITNQITKLKSPKNCYWIGLAEKKGKWYWVNGKKASYTNWASDEPNDYKGHTETYAHLYGVDKKGLGVWNDCTEKGASYASDFYELKNYGFICEWDSEETANGTSEAEYNGVSVQLTMEVGDKLDMSAFNKGKRVSEAQWKSSDPKVAKVSSKGKITAMDIGNCTVTWKSGSAVFTVYIEVE